MHHHLPVELREALVDVVGGDVQAGLGHMRLLDCAGRSGERVSAAAGQVPGVKSRPAPRTG
jgi:hypothetical protein